MNILSLSVCTSISTLTMRYDATVTAEGIRVGDSEHPLNATRASRTLLRSRLCAKFLVLFSSQNSLFTTRQDAKYAQKHVVRVFASINQTAAQGVPFHVAEGVGRGTITMENNPRGVQRQVLTYLLVIYNSHRHGARIAVVESPVAIRKWVNHLSTLGTFKGSDAIFVYITRRHY